MNPTSLELLAAAAPGVGPYVSLIKFIVTILLLAGWAACMQWVDKDTDIVKTRRELWNMIVMSGGFAGFVVLVGPPWYGPLYFAGLLAFGLVAGGALIYYVLHRNGRVTPANRVLTPEHLKRVLSGGGGDRRKKIEDKGKRINLTDSEDNEVVLPSDHDEALAYQVTQDFLFDMLWRRASDVDISEGKEKYRVVFRIDGVASEHSDGLSAEDGQRVFRYLKGLAGLNVEEIRRPQRGRIKVSLLGNDVDKGLTEVHSSGSTAGERLRVRVQAGPVLMRTHELGMAEARHTALKTMLGQSHGMLLIGARPHHGLTTTQYAILRSHDAYIQNIHALERRTLLDLDNITQRLYNGENRDVNFARTLQSILHQQPTIVMISECEDRETAHIATRAAVTDRKIYMGIVANDCFDALSKYITYVNDNRASAKALVGVVSQRLVRLLCEQCREAFRPDPGTLKKLNLSAGKIEFLYRPPKGPQLDKKGREIICPACQGTGYVGRTGLFELMVVDDEIRKLIAAGAPTSKIKVQCRKNRMPYLQEEGLFKVMDGVTSLNEILRVLRENSS